MRRDALVHVEPYGDFRLLVSVPSRLKGLLGSRCTAAPVALLPCAAIHTIGMRYPIDVAAADAEGRILGVCLGLPPGRRWRVPGSFAIFERPASRDFWFSAGERTELVLCARKDKE